MPVLLSTLSGRGHLGSYPCLRSLSLYPGPPFLPRVLLALLHTVQSSLQNQNLTAGI